MKGLKSSPFAARVALPRGALSSVTLYTSPCPPSNCVCSPTVLSSSYFCAEDQNQRDIVLLCSAGATKPSILSTFLCPPALNRTLTPTTTQEKRECKMNPQTPYRKSSDDFSSKRNTTEIPSTSSPPPCLSPLCTSTSQNAQYETNSVAVVLLNRIHGCARTPLPQRLWRWEGCAAPRVRSGT